MAVDMGDIYQRPRESGRKVEGLGQRPKGLKEEEPQRSLRRKDQRVGGRGRSPVGKGTGIFQKGASTVSNAAGSVRGWAESWEVPLALATRRLDRK